MTLFDSAWLKWGRAVVHAQALDSDIRKFTADLHGKPLARIVTRYDAKRNGFVFVVKQIPTLPAIWNLYLGDAIGNFRSALDHLAWAVYKRGRTPEAGHQVERAIYFPIARKRADFSRAIGKIPGARRADIAIIRRYQPYLRGLTRVPWHCLTILDDMSREDKHREILELWMAPTAGRFRVIEANDCIVTGAAVRPTGHAFQENAEFAYIRARKTGAKPDLKVQYEIAAEPAFQEGLSLRQWLDVTTITIARLLKEFAEPPRTTNSLGIERGRITEANKTWSALATAYSSTRGIPKIVVTLP